MRDIGHERTERIVQRIERDIKREFKRAEEEARAKLDDYLRRFEIKDRLKRRALANGQITLKEYNEWRKGQILVGERWQTLVDQLAQGYADATQNARSMAYRMMPEIFAENVNYGMYLVEMGIGEDTSFTLWSRDAVSYLFSDGEFYHAPGRTLAEDIARGKVEAWNRRQVQSVMMQSILQGESIPHMAMRLAHAVGESNEKVAIRNARTMATGIQNAGRQVAFTRGNNIAQKYGMKVRKQWLATLDGRTRHWHANLDGEVVDVNESWVNDYGEIEYPGDPGADPANVYNCRCTMVSVIEGIGLNNSVRPEDTGRVMGKGVENISYDDWKAGKYKQKSDPITKQKDIEKTMKNYYTNKYRQY